MKTLIKNGYIVTMDEDKNVYSKGALIIDNDRISWLGSAIEQEKSAEKFDRIIDAKGKLIIPGLINAHTHNVYYLMRGLGMDRSLKSWLNDAIWPCLKEINKDEAYMGSLLGCLENIKSGTTFLVDNYYMAASKKDNIDGVLRGIEDTGIRAIMARGYHDVPFNVPRDFLESEEEVVDEYTRMLEVWNGKNNGQIGIWMSPVNLLYSSISSLRKIGELAEKFGVGIHTHVAEARFEVEEIKKRYGRSFVEVFSDLGLVNDRFHAVHSVHLTPGEMDILANEGASVMFNPCSNMLLASGIAPIEEMKRRNVKVALGTDAPNNNQDMIETLKFATLLPRVEGNNVTAITSYEALEMATIQGAKSVGLAHEIGSLEVGKRADITIVNMEILHNVPNNDPVATLVYSSNKSDVDMVFIGGDIVLADGKLTGFSEDEVVRDVRNCCESLYRRCDIL